MFVQRTALETVSRDFPGGPVVKTPHYNAVGTGSIPGQGTKISQCHSQKTNKQTKKKTRSNIITNSIKTLNGPYQKIFKKKKAVTDFKSSLLRGIYKSLVVANKPDQNLVSRPTCSNFMTLSKLLTLYNLSFPHL